MALRDDQGPARCKTIDLILRTQNPDGSWPAFEGDDTQGCWATSLALIALHSVELRSSAIEKALWWLLNNQGREGHWFWKWKFRTVDRGVQFNPEKYGWPWFPGTVSWVIPTAFSLIALKQSLRCCRNKQILTRIRIGTEMLIDRACPDGGWNAGNGIVFGAALKPHIDTTAIALLALTDATEPAAAQSVEWLRKASVDCLSAYSLAWAALAFVMHQDQALDRCIANLLKVVSSKSSTSNVENLSLAAIAINAAERNANPFHVVI